MKRKVTITLNFYANNSNSFFVTKFIKILSKSLKKCHASIEKIVVEEINDINLCLKSGCPSPPPKRKVKEDCLRLPNKNN